MREALTCYDSIGGRVGIADALVARSFLVLGDGAGEVTEEGRAWLARFGTPIAEMGGPNAHSALLVQTGASSDRISLGAWAPRVPHLRGTRLN